MRDPLGNHGNVIDHRENAGLQAIGHDEADTPQGKQDNCRARCTRNAQTRQRFDDGVAQQRENDAAGQRHEKWTGPLQEEQHGQHGDGDQRDCPGPAHRPVQRRLTGSDIAGAALGSVRDSRCPRQVVVTRASCVLRVHDDVPSCLVADTIQGVSCGTGLNPHRSRAAHPRHRAICMPMATWRYRSLDKARQSICHLSAAMMKILDMHLRHRQAAPKIRPAFVPQRARSSRCRARTPVFSALAASLTGKRYPSA